MSESRVAPFLTVVKVFYELGTNQAFDEVVAVVIHISTTPRRPPLTSPVNDSFKNLEGPLALH